MAIFVPRVGKENQQRVDELIERFGEDATGLPRQRNPGPIIARQRTGVRDRGGKTESLKLASGDVLVMGGASRLCYHGIDRVIAGTSTLLKDGGRINLTLRRVTKP